MATVYPFQAVMPHPDQVRKVAAPPYDVVNTDEAVSLTEGNPLSFLRVSRPEIELPEGTDLYAPEVYQKAADNYERLKNAAPLKPDTEAHYYIYALEMGGRRQVGIAAAVSVDDYDNDVVKKHEKTRKAKEDDRTRHIMTLCSQTGPVFLTYHDSTSVDAVTDEVMQGAPLFDFTAADGIRHSVWPVPADKTEALRAAFTAIPTLYISDGHHRAASASRTRAAFRDQNPDHTGNEAYNRFYAVLFPAGQLHILPYNRVVTDLNGLSEENFLAALRERADVVETSETEPVERGTVHVYLGGKWYRMTFPEDQRPDSPAEALDVSLLQNLVLTPLLGIDDPRTSKRVDFVGGIRGTGELERRVDSGECAAAFSMFPTTVEELIAISDAGEIMPPKSTWFEPKLRDGLLCHDI